jgi:LacI family transcriptional regulator
MYMKKKKSHPTIIDVARLAGVSKSTVSRVISGGQEWVSDESRQKVEAAIQELGYEYNAMARSMRTNRTNMIMLAIPDINNPFWPEVARGIQDLMEKAGYAVIFANSDWLGHRETSFLRLARRNGLDGILINPIQVTNAELLASGIPTVVLGLRDDYPDFDNVGSDSNGATRMALDYLFSLGHQRIGLLLGKHQNNPRRTRLDAYLDFHAQCGLSMDPELIVEVPFEHKGGEEGMQRMLNLSLRPTAVLASNDTIAIGALHAAITCGVEVPWDLSIMGLDDIYAASLTIPPISTVAKPKYKIGNEASRLLLARIRGGASEPARLAIPCHLVIRGSTAKISG